MTGKCIIFSAPSGSGKSTLIHWLRDEHPELRLQFSVSAASREPRPGEVDGKDYRFITTWQFTEHIAAGDFLEYEEVYGGQFYGTLRAPVLKALSEGYNVLFDIDVKGGIRIKEHFADKALSIFICPPSLDTLRQRLTDRGTESAEKIEMRLSRAEEEMSYAPRFDRIVVNDDLQQAKDDVYRLVHGFLMPDA